MNVSRGSFLKICGAAALGQRMDVGSWIGALTGSSGGAAVDETIDAVPPAGGFLLREARVHHFRPHVHTAFTVGSGESAPARLVLADVVDGPSGGGIEQFSLLFHGPATGSLSPATYPFQHPVLGAFDLSIAPVGRPSASRTVYEACFSSYVERRDNGTCRPPS